MVHGNWFQAQEEGEGTQWWQKEGSVPVHNIVLEFQVKEKSDAADSLWIGPFRREGEIRNFIVFFSHKKQCSCPDLDYSRSERREDSTF